MKNKKGFTIIEIISVLVIIALIATMAIAGITGMTGKTNNKAYNSKIKLIEQAAVQYAKENSEKFKEEFGECTKTSGNCDCTNGDCVYKFNTTVEELIELGYYDSELSKECLVENPREKSKCFDKEPIEIVIDADKEGIEAHFGEEFDPYDVIAPENTMCNLHVEGSEGTNGWYIGSNNKLILSFTIDEAKVARYGISASQSKTYNNIREIPLSSTTGITYYGYVKDIDGNEGICVLKNIKVDATNPTDPNMEIDSTYNLAFNGSNDTYSERVKYSYTIDGGAPVIGVKYRIADAIAQHSVSVNAFDYAGNQSNIVTKTLTVSEPQNGTVTEVKDYYCEEGYTCTTTPCKATSKCKKIEMIPPTETKKYKCSLNNEIYTTFEEAYDACIRHESGTVTTVRYHACPDGYSTTDDPVQSTSTCKKVIATSQPFSAKKYECYIDGVYKKTYYSREEANQNCVKHVPGAYTQVSVNTCPSGYTCSGSACTSCTKTTTANLVSTTSYTCPSGFTCSNNPCRSTSTCTSRTVTSTNYNYIAYCSETGSYNYYFGDESRTGTALTSCSEKSISCNASNYGKNNVRCTSYHKWVGSGHCHDSLTNKKRAVTVGRYDTEALCLYAVHYDYECDGITEFFETPLCTKTKYYSKWEKKCYRSAIKKYGPYYCNTSVNSSCGGSCPSGYTKTVTRDGCSNSSVQGNSCSSNTTCTTSTTTTCVKTVNASATTKYSCPSGYTCSNNCNSSSSTCTKVETTSSVSQNKYKCTRTGNLYDTLEEVQNNCIDVESGTIVEKDGYACQQGFVCSDGDACNSSSACYKYDIKSTLPLDKYYCSLTEAFYNDEATARSSCSRDVRGDVLDHYIYSCVDPYTCSTSPCAYNSMCQTTYTINPVYDKTYYCSLNTDIQYLSSVEARAACQNNCGNGKYNFGTQKCYILE